MTSAGGNGRPALRTDKDPSPGLASYNRAEGRERDFLGFGVALAVTASTATGDDVVATALLAAQLPGLVEAVEAGVLTVRHVHAAVAVLTGVGLTLEQQQAVLLIALAMFTNHPRAAGLPQQPRPDAGTPGHDAAHLTPRTCRRAGSPGLPAPTR